MLMLKMIFWVGIISLYLGFAGVLGILLRQFQVDRASWMQIALPVAHAILLFTPASVFVLEVAGALPLARLALLLTGIFVVWLGWAQPDWASTRLWQRSFGHHYFAAVMLLTAIWGFGMTLLSGSIVPSLIGAMACAAGIASFSTAPEART